MTDQVVESETQATVLSPTAELSPTADASVLAPAQPRMTRRDITRELPNSIPGGLGW